MSIKRIILKFFGWCPKPSIIKVKRFHPSNLIVLLSVSLVLASILAVAMWQQASTLLAFTMNPLFWGGRDYESPRRLQEDGDSVYVVGRTASYGAGESNIFLLKYDVEGTLVWNITWDEPSYDWAEEFTVTEDAIYISGATMQNRTSSDSDVVLLKYDKDGRLLWSRKWGGIAWDDESSSEEGEDVEAHEGHVYVVGTTYQNSSWIPGIDVRIAEQDANLLKFDTDGGLVWQKQYGGDHTFEYGYCLETANDELYVTCKILTFDAENERLERLRLYKLDLNGIILWNRTYDEISCDSIITPRGMMIEGESIYVSGGISRRNVGWRLFTCKFDLTGELQWIHILEDEDYSTRGSMAIEDGHLFVMASDRRDPKNWEVALLDYDLDGNLLGNFTGGTDRNETAFDMYVSGEQIFMMGTISPSQDWVDVFLAAVDNPYSEDETEGKTDLKIPGFPFESITCGVLIVSFLYHRGRKRSMS